MNIVTTFSKQNYDEYARTMIDTFVKFWSPDIKLIVYLDQDITLPDRAEVREFPAWFPSWRARHSVEADARGRDPAKNRQGREYDFRRDCLRFSHKIAAITDAARHADNGPLAWMDADIVTFRPIDRDWLFRAIDPRPSWMSWIPRARPYPDCCFMTWDMATDHSRRFMHDLRAVYESDGVFSLKETHDSYVIEQVVKSFPTPRSMCGHTAFNKHHPFPYIELGKRLDHLKGSSRKAAGRSAERGAR